MPDNYVVANRVIDDRVKGSHERSRVIGSRVMRCSLMRATTILVQ